MNYKINFFKPTKEKNIDIEASPYFDINKQLLITNNFKYINDQDRVCWRQPLY